MIALQDAPFANNDNGRGKELPTEVLFNGPAGKKVLDWWVGMYNDGLFNDVGPGWDNHRAAFSSGTAAIALSSSSDVNLFTKALNDKGWELGTGFIPHPEGSTGGVAIGGGTLWITNNLTQEQELAAVKLEKFIANDDSQKAWHKGTGYFPVTKSAMDSLENEGWFVENPNYKTAFDQLLVSPGTLNSSGSLLGVFPETRAIIQSAIQECYQGKDTQVALDEAAKKVNDLITEWNEVIQL
jgi:sn-glycerol 3-phosphate transport system substrate-binding protein